MPREVKRWPLFVLPSLTLAGAAGFVGLGTAGSDACAARVWGGPTDALPWLSGWLEACVDGPSLRGQQLTVTAEPLRPGAATPPTRRASARVELDEEGRAEFRLDFGAPLPGAFELRVVSGERELARGRAALPSARFFEGARERGGWLGSAEPGPLQIRVAAGRGAFAVPFAAPLRFDVQRAGAPEAGARLELRAEGAELSATELQTDARGHALAVLTPSEHAVFVVAQATARDGTQARFRSSLPVVPGACVADWSSNGRLEVQAPVERSDLFVSLLSPAGRVAGARVRLTPDGSGLSRGLWQPPAEAAALARWAVCSSDPRGSGLSLVGWPLFTSWEEPPRTRDAPDRLLLDGVPAVKAEHRQQRRRAYALALMWGALGGTLTVAWLWVSARRQQHQVDRELGGVLDPSGVERLTAHQASARLWVFLIIGLGFLGLVALLALRLTV